MKEVLGIIPARYKSSRFPGKPLVNILGKPLVIHVAEKVVEYRRADLKIQSDRHISGLNLESDLLSAKAAMAKAESDLYAAQYNYRIALSELKILTGDY